MSTEIFDYIKALSKKKYFYINVVNMFLGINIIICSFFSVRYGVSMSRYAILFGCAAALFALNSYKSYMRKSKNCPVFLLLSLLFTVLTGYMLMLVIRAAG